MTPEEELRWLRDKAAIQEDSLDFVCRSEQKLRAACRQVADLVSKPGRKPVKRILSLLEAQDVTPCEECGRYTCVCCDREEEEDD